MSSVDPLPLDPAAIGCPSAGAASVKPRFPTPQTLLLFLGAFTRFGLDDMFCDVVSNATITLLQFIEVTMRFMFPSARLSIADLSEFDGKITVNSGYPGDEIEFDMSYNSITRNLEIVMLDESRHTEHISIDDPHFIDSIVCAIGRYRSWSDKNTNIAVDQCGWYRVEMIKHMMERYVAIISQFTARGEKHGKHINDFANSLLEIVKRASLILLNVRRSIRS